MSACGSSSSAAGGGSHDALVSRPATPQEAGGRRYAPLLSLLNPIEDTAASVARPTTATPPPAAINVTAAPSPERDHVENHDDAAEAEGEAAVAAPLLAPPVRDAAVPPVVGESSDGNTARLAGTSWVSRRGAKLRALWRDVVGGCALEVRPADAPRRFSPLERAKMGRYESVDTYEAESMLYKDHLETRSHEPRWFMWVFVLVLGIATSALAVGMVICLHILNSMRYELLGFALRGFSFADAQRYPNGTAQPSQDARSGSVDASTELDVWAMLRGYSVGLYGIAAPRHDWAGYAMWLLFAAGTSAIASGLCFLVPESVGSGVPEVRAYLNGVAYPMMRSVRVLVAKIVAVTFTVASGVCTGHYGHLVLAGAMLGAQLLERRHGVRCYHVHFVDCFRNPRDRRIVVVIGAAAGIAAAFCVSVGGLLVILELLSAVFPVRFALYVFAACLLSMLFTQVYWSYGVQFDPRYRPHGGLLRREAVVLLRSALPFGEHASMNLLSFAPAGVVGLVCGLCAVLFVRLSWAALYCRRRLEVRLGTKAIRYVLPIAFTLLYVSVHYWTAIAFAAAPPRLPTGDAQTTDDSVASAPLRTAALHLSANSPSSVSASSSGAVPAAALVPAVCRRVPGAVRRGRNATTIGFYGMNGFLCPADSYADVDAAPPLATDARAATGASSSSAPASGLPEQTVRVVDAYASLAFSYADSTLQTLLSQRTEQLLPWTGLVTFSVLYFAGSAVYSGLALCGDTMLPSLVIGAALGRCVGAAVHAIAVGQDPRAATWADPAVFALLGAGSFLSATSGLSFGVGAILIESTADFRHLLPLMLAIAVARRVLRRWGRDAHTVYLEARAVPLLNAEPYLERFSLLDARHVMCSPVVALPVVCPLNDVARVLRTTSHHGFPVVSLNDGTFKGIVTRAQLELLLWHIIMTDGRINHCTYDVMQRVEDHVFHNGWEGIDPTDHLHLERLHTNQVSLYPYVDTSAFTVLDTAALPRTYEMFTTLGLRHLVVVDRSNYAVGMITRKDLVGDRLSTVLGAQDDPVTRTGRAAATGVVAAALATLRKPLHPTASQVAEAARQSSTRTLVPPAAREDAADASGAAPRPREEQYARAICRASLLHVPTPSLQVTRTSQ